MIGHSPGKECLVQGPELLQDAIAIAATVETELDKQIGMQPGFSNCLVEVLHDIIQPRLELPVVAEGISLEPLDQGELHASKLCLFILGAYSCSISSSSFALASCSPCL